MTVKLKIKKLHPNASIPQRGSELAGGLDVTATEILHEAPDFVICKLGFSLEIPAGYKLTLVPRSSITKTRWLLQNSPGLGDADFRGEYQYRFRCIPYAFEVIRHGEGYITYEQFPYKVGDRIGQVYLEEVIPIEFEEVKELGDSSRGEGGFGSTGNAKL